MFEVIRGIADRFLTLPSYGVASTLLFVLYAVQAEIRFGAKLGLAPVDLDKDLGAVPTILDLFRNSTQSGPMEMTAWDRALLHALYSTPQKNKTQVSEIQTAMLKDIAAKAGK